MTPAERQLAVTLRDDAARKAASAREKYHGECPDEDRDEWIADMEQKAEMLTSLLADADRLAALVELGQEMHRILWHMTKAQKADLLPDWFRPRLRELVPMPDDIMLTPEERAARPVPPAGESK